MNLHGVILLDVEALNTANRTEIVPENNSLTIKAAWNEMNVVTSSVPKLTCGQKFGR